MSCSQVCDFTNDGLRFRNPFNVRIQNIILRVLECQKRMVCAYINLPVLPANIVLLSTTWATLYHLSAMFISIFLAQ